MLLLLTITQNCFIWRHCRIRIDTYQVLIMNIHSPFLMTPANTKQVNMKARESETTGGPRLYLCQLSYSLDMYQRMWNVGCTHTAEHRLTSLFPKSACSHPLCFLEMSRVVCVHALPADPVLVPQVLHSCQSGRVEAVPQQVLYWECIVQ